MRAQPVVTDPDPAAVETMRQLAASYQAAGALDLAAGALDAVALRCFPISGEQPPQVGIHPNGAIVVTVPVAAVSAAMLEGIKASKLLNSAGQHAAPAVPVLGVEVRVYVPRSALSEAGRAQLAADAGAIDAVTEAAEPHSIG